MRTDRILSIIMLLLSGKTIKADELAKIFNVSTRTIGRDAEEIANAGIPIETMTGSKGGIKISEKFRTDNASLFTADIGNAILTITSMYPKLLEIDDAYILANYKNSKAKEKNNKDKTAALAIIKLRFHESYMGYINQFYDYVDIRFNSDGYCVAHIKIPDSEEAYDGLLALGDRCECVAPLHIRNYLRAKIQSMKKLYN